MRILDPSPFMEVLEHRPRTCATQRVYLAEYKKYVEQTVVYDREYQLLICIMRDVTDEETEREKKEDISRQTVEIADKVVDKQMRIVQEIASLLGETAAETKIALTKAEGDRLPMNDLCADIGWKSINHVGEQLCGDHVDVVEQGENSTVIVLADGLGSGVKASILSTLTSQDHLHHDGRGAVAGGMRCHHRGDASHLLACAALPIPPLPSCILSTTSAAGAHPV